MGAFLETKQQAPFIHHFVSGLLNLLRRVCLFTTLHKPHVHNTKPMKEKRDVLNLCAMLIVSLDSHKPYTKQKKGKKNKRRGAPRDGEGQCAGCDCL